MHSEPVNERTGDTFPTTGRLQSPSSPSTPHSPCPFRTTSGHEIGVRIVLSEENRNDQVRSKDESAHLYGNMPGAAAADRALDVTSPIQNAQSISPTPGVAIDQNPSGAGA